jgi:exopolyphosphatase/guanosine-5'-triphosphate,3'-diphosphate pyrophosphatase
MTLGMIDVGTNSIHLVVGLLGLKGTFHVMIKERELVRLGEGGLVRDVLTRSAMRRAMIVLRRYAEILRRCGVDEVEAVATSAVRQARNGRAFVAAVRRELGLPLRIISGREEARLIYLGVLQVQRVRHPALVLSIGGGSAQLSCGNGVSLSYRASIPLGAARMAQRFIRHDPVLSEEVRALHEHAQRAWKPIARAIRRYRWRQAWGASAMIGQLLMAEALHHEERRRRAMPDRLTISRAALARLVERVAASTAHERMQIPGLDPRREDFALAAAIVLLTWMDTCRIQRLHFAQGSLREGLVVDYVLRHFARQAKLQIDDPAARLFAANGAKLVLPWSTRPLRKAVQRHLLEETA